VLCRACALRGVTATLAPEDTPALPASLGAVHWRHRLLWQRDCVGGRGVPVLTIPTEGHGEQVLNAAAHQRNFPRLVRARPRIEIEDIHWLVHFDPLQVGGWQERPWTRQCAAALHCTLPPFLPPVAPLNVVARLVAPTAAMLTTDVAARAVRT
jgi:hypothetical protein